MNTVKEWLHQLQHDVDSWNTFKQDYRGKRIDFASMDLRNIDFTNADLKSVDFQDSNLSSSTFRNCELNGALFARANLCWTKIRNTNAQYCTFNEADMYSASFTDSNLNGSEFIKSNVDGVSFLNSVITECDFQYAKMTGSVMSSRSQLISLAHYMADDQLSGIIFLDERVYEKASATEEKCTLIVKIDGKSITPFNLSYLLLALEGIYNNILFLSETKSESLEEIIRSIEPYYQGVGARDSLKIQKIHEGSIIIELTAAAGLLFTLSKIVNAIGSQILEHKKMRLEQAKNEALIRKTEAEMDQIIIANINQSYEIANHVAAAMTVNSYAVEQNRVRLIELSTKPLENILNKYQEMGLNVSAEFIDN